MNQKLSTAKTALVLDQPFFGSLVCHLVFQEDTKCATAWTDGTTLGYNPVFVDSLPHAEIVGLLAHEVMHCAAGHPFRRDGREMKRWNVACDYAINDIINEAGISLPAAGLVTPKEFKGKSSEWIYDRIPPIPQGQAAAPGEVRDEPSGSGDNADTGEEGIDKVAEGEWKEITRQAATQAQMRGNLPEGLKRFAKEAAKSKVDWKDVLRRFVQQNCKDDYTWRTPNPRYAAMDIYLPSMQSESMPGLVIAVDTSGSMDDIALAKAKAEVLSVMDETNPAWVKVMYADAAVAKVDHYERGESIVFKAAGGGGTDFRPVFAAVDKMEDTPACIIYITDLQGAFPEASGMPTLWVTDTDGMAPFGETIRIS